MLTRLKTLALSLGFGLIAALAIATPASAAGSFTGATTITAGSSLASGSVLSSVANTTGTVSSVEVTAMWGGISTTGFTPLSTCGPSGSSFADCGITQIVAGGSTFTSTGNSSGTTVSIVGYQGQYYPYIKFNFSPALPSGSPIEVTFGANALTAPQVNGTYPLKIQSAQESFSVDLTVTNAKSTVYFNRNTSSSDMTRTEQLASSNTNLTPNSFTNTGYTFSGWATTRANATAGTVAYADGASFAFTSPSDPNSMTRWTNLYAVWTTGGGGGGGGSTSGSATMTLGASTGSLVAGSSVAVSATGLQSTAAYTVVVQSNPQTIGSGNAVSGAVNTSVTLPSGLEAGWHTLTFTSTAADGSPVSSVLYFKVSASGTLLESSTSIPAELANTGSTLTGILAPATAFILGGLLLVAMRRRKSRA